jgi:hypothetical protein
MTHVPSWRRFKRLQIVSCLVALLVYGGAAIHAWRVLPGAPGFKASVLLVFPAVWTLATFVVPLQLKPLRRALKHYVWKSFSAGFGQTPTSVIGGLGLLIAAAAFMYLQIFAALHGGPYPAGAFSAYGAGIGILLAQALLVTALEREPKIRVLIEEEDEVL